MIKNVRAAGIVDLIAYTSFDRLKPGDLSGCDQESVSIRDIVAGCREGDPE